MDNKSTGRMLVLAAALMWSSCGLFAKSPLFLDWPAESRGLLLAFWRAALAALVLLPFVRRPRWRPGLPVVAAAFTGMNVTYLSAMTLTTAANAIWLQSTAPLWVFIIGTVVFAEPIVRRDLVPLAFGIAGIGLILFYELPGQARAGAILGVLAGVCYGGVLIGMRRLRDENAVWLIAVNHAAAAVILLPWAVYQGRWPSPVQLLVLAAFGAFQMAIPYLLLVRALRSISSQEAAAIGLLEPVLTPVWVYLAWGEQPAWWTLAGASLILIGLMLRYVVWPLAPKLQTRL
jgi:drug/metabolite transporter, DME family